jgi:S-adenosylmethionine decarboxylase
MMERLGTEWMVDAAGCRAEILRDPAALRALFDRIIAEPNLNPLGDAVWHRFPNTGGVTGVALLAESHLTIHTWPETGRAAINLFCCRQRPAWPWEARSLELLGATRVTAREVERRID